MKKLFPCIATISLFFSCSGIKIKGVETAENVNFRSYKTYNFYEVVAKGDTIPFVFNQRVGMLKSAVAAELNKKGFVQTADNPDLFINIGIHVTRELQTRDTQFGQDGPFYMGQRNYTWKSKTIETGYYRNGAVTIHVVDAHQVRLVWQGTAESIVPAKDSQLQEEIKNGMARLFTQFPLEPR
ncbi:MAG: DUF4136 domain-containing protein [Bacteroidota bacterium]